MQQGSGGLARRRGLGLQCLRMKARFFCDNCGREVKAGAARCSGCGRFFSAVKCPRCAFQGDATLFANGCPACGYLFDSEGRVSRQKKKDGESSLSRRAFYWITSFLVLLLLVFLVLLIVQPFNR